MPTGDIGKRSRGSMISGVDGSLKEALRLSWWSAGIVHEGWGSTWCCMDKSIVVGSRASVLWEPDCDYVKVKLRFEVREVRAKESKRARRLRGGGSSQ